MAIPQSTDVSIRLHDMTPEEVVAARGHLVTITLSMNNTQSGYLYVIDPICGTVILKHETEDKAIVLLRHQIRSIQGNIMKVETIIISTMILKHISSS
jgi:hypothetical protein